MSLQLSMLLGRLRFKHLRVLDALARSGNLHQVAAEMTMTQPAATKIVQDAEDLLGIRLFERRPRGMDPTEVGVFVIEYARRILRETEVFTEGLGNLKAGGFGALAIGAIMATTPGLLPRAIAELKQRRPLMTIRLMAATSDILLEALERNEIALAIARFTDPRNELAFSIEPLGKEELCIFVAPDHPLAGRAQISFAELASLPWVLQPPSSPSRQLIDRIFIDAGIGALNNRVETTSIFATLHLVRDAGMVACLPRSIIKEGVGGNAFVTLPVELPNLLGPLGIVTRKNEALSANATDFIDVLRRIAAEP